MWPTVLFFAPNTIPSRVFLLIAADIVLHIEIPRDDNCNFGRSHIMTASLQKALNGLWDSHQLHSLCLPCMKDFLLAAQCRFLTGGHTQPSIQGQTGLQSVVAVART